MDGAAQALPNDQGRQLTIAGNVFRTGGVGAPLQAIGYTTDPKAEPPAIDLGPTGSALGGGTDDGSAPIRGIYELKGDRLVFCFSRPGGLRPTAFATGEKPGGGQRMVTLRRGQKPTDPPAIFVGSLRPATPPPASVKIGTGGAKGGVASVSQPGDEAALRAATEAELDHQALKSKVGLLAERINLLDQQIATYEISLAERPVEEHANEAKNLKAAEADRIRLRADYLDAVVRLRKLEGPAGSGSGQPAGDRPGEAGPAKVWKAKPGDILIVEVLEALPGRPVSGERRVREDGTIGLGFYGEVAVEGLTRREIKVKVVEQMRKYLKDEVLGLKFSGEDEKDDHAVAPADTDRVFVDTVDPSSGRIGELERKLDALLKKLDERK